MRHAEEERLESLESFSAHPVGLPAVESGETDKTGAIVPCYGAGPRRPTGVSIIICAVESRHDVILPRCSVVSSRGYLVIHPSVNRVFRVSLRTVLVLLTLLCGLMGWKARQVTRQKEAIAWIKSNDGYITYDFELTKSVVHLDENGDVAYGPKAPGPRWLRELLGIDFSGASSRR